jgi:hypothetical protein
MMARLILTLQVIGVGVLLLCVAGNALLGDWSGVALAVVAAILLVMA